MPAFSTYLEQAHLAAIFVLRISGLPILWSNAAIPARWSSGSTVDLGGETYTWAPSLMIEEMTTETTKIEPKGGVGQSKSLDFKILTVGYQSEGLETDVTLDVMLNNIIKSTGRRASLREDLVAYEEFNIKLVSNPWETNVPDPFYLYFGTETIKVEDLITNNATFLSGLLVRGRYGSYGKDHTGTVHSDSSVQGGAMYIADYPLTITGRFAEVWMVPGEFHTSASGKPFFVPFGDSLGASDNKVIYAGVVDGTHEDGTQVTIRTSSLDTLIQGNVMSQHPQAKISAARPMSSGKNIYIGPHNWTLSFEIIITGGRHNPLVYSSTNVFTAGDSITIGGFSVINGTHWNAGADLFATYLNIAAAIRAHVDIIPIASAYAEDGVVVIYPTSAAPVTISTSSVGNVLGSTVNNTSDRPGYGAKAARLVRSTNNDGKPPYTEVTEGLYSRASCSAIFKETINSFLPPTVFIAGTFVVAENGIWSFVGAFAPRPWGLTADLYIQTMYGPTGGFVRDLGFTDAEYKATKPASVDSSANITLLASKKPPVLRIPALGGKAPSRIYLDEFGFFARENFYIDGGVNDLGASLAKMVHIKDVGVFTFTGVGNDATGQRHLTGVLRASSNYGVGKEEEYYLDSDPTSDKQLEVNRIANFTNVSVNRAMLYILCSSFRGGGGFGDFDILWPGFGLNIPERFIDLNSFLSPDGYNRQSRQATLLLPSDTARGIFDEELKATMQQIVADNGKLYLIQMTQSQEGLPSTPRICGPSQLTTDPDKGIAVDRQTSRIVNVVNVNAAYDYITGKYHLNQINRKQDSIGTWGQQQSITVNLRGIANTSAGEAIGKALATQIFSIYSQPYAIFDVDIAVKEAWLWGLSDDIILSHPSIPHLTSARRGAVDVPCKIVGRKNYYAGGGDKFVTLSLMSWAMFGGRKTVWAPSVRLTYDGIVAKWRVSETLYGGSLHGKHPSDYFQTGYRIMIHPLGSASDKTTHTINTKSGAVNFVFLTLSGSPDTSLLYIATYAKYDDSLLHVDQRKLAYMSDNSGIINKSIGTDPAFIWQ